MVTRLRNEGKTAQRNRGESADCARWTLQQPTRAPPNPTPRLAPVNNVLQMATAFA